uniref:ATP synthase F0 subunit 8 n=1 Tax=Dendroctonus rufipennis TaxID=77170 RepID=UPI0020284550|nr:ATP synthase F0 subunit 8 [Dendroctonus rufipennis]UQK95002.1 ATP synthase F0 subunit 8 [Dendroctonus rufipennis]
MPQMAPLSWLILYIFFSSLFLMAMILSYFNFYYMTKKNKITPVNTCIDWKW